MKNKLKCVVAGSFGQKDIGDDVMLTEALEYLTSELKLGRDSIVLVGGDPDMVSDYHQHPKENCFSMEQFKRNLEILENRNLGFFKRLTGILKIAFKSRSLPKFNFDLDMKLEVADFALITGGGTINSRSREGRSINRVYSFVRYFKIKGCPYAVSGQTFGPLGIYADHDRMAKEIVESSEVFTVRDSMYSRRYLDLLDVSPRRFLETSDDAYRLDYKCLDLPAEVEDFVEGGKVFAFSVTDYTVDTDEKVLFLLSIVEKILNGFFEKAVFIAHTPGDLSALLRIFDMLSDELKARVLVPPTIKWQGGQLKKLISRCDFAIGCRYHFIVFAGSTDTPFVGLSGNHYSYIKQHGFAEKLGLGRFVLSERDSLDADCVIRSVKESLEVETDNKNLFPKPSESLSMVGSWVRERFDE